MRHQFAGIQPPVVSESEARRQVAAWERESVALALDHLAETDWAMDDMAAAREGWVFATDPVGSVEAVLVG